MYIGVLRGILCPAGDEMSPREKSRGAKWLGHRPGRYWNRESRWTFAARPCSTAMAAPTWAVVRPAERRRRRKEQRSEQPVGQPGCHVSTITVSHGYAASCHVAGQRSQRPTIVAACQCTSSTRPQRRPRPAAACLACCAPTRRWWLALLRRCWLYHVEVCQHMSR